jgi:hypothetical protein
VPELWFLFCWSLILTPRVDQGRCQGHLHFSQCKSMSVKQGDETWRTRRKPFFLDGWPNGQALPPRWYPLQLGVC